MLAPTASPWQSHTELVFNISVADSVGIGIGVHVSKVGDEKSVSKRNSKFREVRCRVQFGC